MITHLVLAAIAIGTLLFLAYRGSNIATATSSLGALTVISAMSTGLGLLTWLLAGIFLLCLLFTIPSLRQRFSPPLF